MTKHGLKWPIYLPWRYTRHIIKLHHGGATLLLGMRPLFVANCFIKSCICEMQFKNASGHSCWHYFEPDVQIMMGEMTATPCIRRTIPAPFSSLPGWVFVIKFMSWKQDPMEILSLPAIASTLFTYPRKLLKLNLASHKPIKSFSIKTTKNMEPLSCLNMSLSVIWVGVWR